MTDLKLYLMLTNIIYMNILQAREYIYIYILIIKTNEALYSLKFHVIQIKNQLSSKITQYINTWPNNTLFYVQNKQKIIN